MTNFNSKLLNYRRLVHINSIYLVITYRNPDLQLITEGFSIPLTSHHRSLHVSQTTPWTWRWKSLGRRPWEMRRRQVSLGVGDFISIRSGYRISTIDIQCRTYGQNQFWKISKKKSVHEQTARRTQKTLHLEPLPMT